MSKTIASQDFLKNMGKVHETFRRLLEGGLPLEALQRIIDDPILRGLVIDSWVKIVDLDTNFLDTPRNVLIAKQILGNDKVYKSVDATAALGVEIIEHGPICYTVEQLEEAAKENKEGHDWRLVWNNRLSIRELSRMFGHDKEKQPCFRRSFDWLLEMVRDEWSNDCPSYGGYYLIDFKPRFLLKNWYDQEGAVAKLGKNFERVNEAVFIEACLSIFKITGERIAEDWYHWGDKITSTGERVLAGYFDSKGIDAYGSNPLMVGGAVGVVIARKPASIFL